jgi:hypothetical protein
MTTPRTTPSWAGRRRRCSRRNRGRRSRWVAYGRRGR